MRDDRVQFNQARSARAWSQHTDDVIITVKNLNLAVRDAETGQRGFLPTGRDDYLQPYQAAPDRVTFLFGELRRLTADNPAEQSRLQTLSPVLQHKPEELAQTVQLRRSVGLDAALGIVMTDSGRLSMKRIESILSAMTQDETGPLSQRLADADRRGFWLRWLMMGGMATALLALFRAAQMLDRAWAHTSRPEAEQRTAVLRLRTALDSLSQGVAVFGADHLLSNWNECFQVLLDLPGAMVRADISHAAIGEHVSGAGGILLENEQQIRLGRLSPRETRRSMPVAPALSATGR